ncbi:MAG: hypothetical protein Q9227_004986 [Pyrenula ochraceoflavens]
MSPSHQSPSPSSPKRPSLPNRTSSTNSLSSSARQSKQNRPYVVGQRSHTRNTSYGKNLNKLPKINSSQAVAEGNTRNHQRKGSGPGTTTPSTSPKVHFNKRNRSHVSLNKAAGQAGLKKNHSATSIVRNQSATQLKKHVVGPLTAVKPQKKKPQKEKAFQISDGDYSTEEEEPGWEDTTSPENTRQNSAYSTRPPSPVEERKATNEQHRHSSPPAPSLQPTYRSEPSFAIQSSESDLSKKHPDLLQHNPRSKGAPPAMSTVSAMATKPQSNHKTASPKPTANGTVSKGTPTGASTSTSAENGISKFIGTSVPSRESSYVPDMDDDYDSPSSFLPNYHPRSDGLPSYSSQPPKHAKLSPRKSDTPVHSRTQQRLDLQRRETMRASTASSASGPIPNSVHDPSSIQMPRPGSRNRSRASAIGPIDPNTARQDFESSTRQLNVIRRLRNPITESLRRLRDAGAMEIHPSSSAAVGKDSNKGPRISEARPASRAGPVAAANGRAALNGSAHNAGDPLNINGKLLSRSLEERRQEHDAHLRALEQRGGNNRATTRPNSRGSKHRVRFQRQGSHDDIGLSRSRGDTDEEEDEQGEAGDGGVERGIVRSGGSEELELLRRIWGAKVWVGD